jgi:2-aminoadipate transaminase
VGAAVTASATLPFAAPVTGITGSLIDSSTSVLAAQRHDVIRFVMVSPAPEAIPTGELAAIAAEVMADSDGYGYVDRHRAGVDDRRDLHG